MSDEQAAKSSFDAHSVVPVDFELQEELGAGAHGIVYKALHKTLGQTVAIKIVRAASGLQDKAKQHFEKEIKAAARLDHPNIVRMLQFGIAADSTPYIVYEFLEGQTLQSYLEASAGNTINANFLSCIFSQLCDALAYAHSQGVTHRDLKPANIMILAKTSASITEVKILDFGIARTQSEIEVESADDASGAVASAQSQTSTSSPIGSPFYMSPEQCKVAPVDARSDIYSLACILYQCLLGKPPFDGESAFHVLYKHMQEPPLLPDKRLSADLNAVLKKALAKVPADRQKNATEFWKELQPGLQNWNSVEAGPGSAARWLGVKVVLPLIGLLILFAYSSFCPSNRAPEKNVLLPSAPARSNLKSISVENELAEIDHIHQVDMMSNAPGLNEKAINSVQKLLPRLQNRGLRFEALDIMGDCQYSLLRWRDAEKTFNEQLKVATLEDGTETIEAVKPYGRLAELFYRQNDIKKAASFARKGLAIERLRGGDNPPRVGLPEYYHCINVKETLEVFYIVLAVEAASRNKIEESLKFFEHAKAAQPIWCGTPIGRPSLLKADLLLKEGNKKAAVAEVNSMLDEICKQETTATPMIKVGFDQFEPRTCISAFDEAACWLETHLPEDHDLICAVCKLAYKFASFHSVKNDPSYVNSAKTFARLCPDYDK